jgi:hypothetical protein
MNSALAYSYDLRAQTYLKPVFAQQTLECFRFVNEHALNSLVAEDRIELGGSSLASRHSFHSSQVDRCWTQRSGHCIFCFVRAVRSSWETDEVSSFLCLFCHEGVTITFRVPVLLAIDAFHEDCVQDPTFPDDSCMALIHASPPSRICKWLKIICKLLCLLYS